MTIHRITKQQQTILTYLYHYRFLNRTHIQNFLNHKTHNRINIWLKDLNEQGYVDRIYSREYGENTKPAIYSIGPNGVGFLKDQAGLAPQQIQKLRRQSGRSKSFMSRCLMLADIRVTLLGFSPDAVSTKTRPTYEFTTTAEVQDEENEFHFLSMVRPQLIVTKHESSSKRSYTIIEVFDPTIPSYAIRKRLGEFVNLYKSATWEEATSRPFPKLLFVCPTKAGMIYTKRHARKLIEENQRPSDLHIWVATAGKVSTDGVTGEIWEEA
jgi:DNA-binding PadR family transcriptional regulator